MIQLDRFFQNPFHSKEISNLELQKFSEDHIAKLTAANENGAWDALLTDTNVAYEAHFGRLADVALQSAIQKAATRTMNERWDGFVKWLTTRGEARIKDRAGKPSAVYTEFFPTGLSEYHQAGVANGQTLATRVRTSAETHAVLLGQDFKTQVSALADDFLAARQLQMGHKGARTDGSSHRDDAKDALRSQLFTNLLTLALAGEKPTEARLYFNQSLLENPAGNKNEDPAPPPAL